MEETMDKELLKYELIKSLSNIYFMDAFSQLTEFLQGELKLLYFLLENENRKISPSDLSEKLHISRPRTTAALTTLKNKGYVTTKESIEDRRRIYVRLTPKGEAFIEKKKDNVEGYFDKYVDSLGEKDTKELIRLINLSIEIMT